MDIDIFESTRDHVSCRMEDGRSELIFELTLSLFHKGYVDDLGLYELPDGNPIAAGSPMLSNAFVLECDSDANEKRHSEHGTIDDEASVASIYGDKSLSEAYRRICVLNDKIAQEEQSITFRVLYVNNIEPLWQAQKSVQDLEDHKAKQHVMKIFDQLLGEGASIENCIDIVHVLMAAILKYHEESLVFDRGDQSRMAKILELYRHINSGKFYVEVTCNK